MDVVLVAIAAFVIMEPVTALVHRVVMHGVGWGLHRSHHRSGHRPRPSRWEANDAFPVVFAAIVCVGFVVGFNVGGAGVLVPLGVGVTAYGAAYALVHDVYIHRRLARRSARRRRPIPLLDRMAEAHAIHHRSGGAPYGMLLPVVPRRARERVSA